MTTVNKKRRLGAAWTDLLFWLAHPPVPKGLFADGPPTPEEQEYWARIKRLQREVDEADRAWKQEVPGEVRAKMEEYRKEP